MRIILLTGQAHSGKTTTLNMVYANLTAGITNPPPKQPIQYGSPDDFECVVKYKNEEGKFQDVAFFTLGDVLYRIQYAILKYSQADVLILAHRQNGNTMNAYAQEIKKYPQHHVVNKTNNNSNDCNTIIGYI
jgi:hypothetical protein